jgi:predicted MFS family arabinose efflux permease
VSGTVLGGFSSRLLSGLIAAHWGWRWSFVVLGCLNLAGAFGVMRLLKPERHLRDVARSAGSFLAAAGAHLRNRGLQASYIVGFGILFSNVALFTYVTFYLAAPPFGLEPAALGSLFTVYLIGAAVNPAVGRAIDRYGQRAVLATAISAAVAGVGLTFVPNVWVVCAGLTISSSGVFASTTAANKQIGWVARENRALAVGVYATFYYLGGSLGAFVPGYFWNLGGWPACAAFIAGVQVTTVIVAVATWKSPERAEARSRLKGLPHIS